MVEDREQPRANIGPEMVLVPSLERAKERVAHQILGVVARTRELQRKGVERIEMCERLALELRTPLRDIRCPLARDNLSAVDRAP